MAVSSNECVENEPGDANTYLTFYVYRICSICFSLVFKRRYTQSSNCEESSQRNHLTSHQIKRGGRTRVFVTTVMLCLF